jgi:hypothetical protein
MGCLFESARKEKSHEEIIRLFPLPVFFVDSRHLDPGNRINTDILLGFVAHRGCQRESEVRHERATSWKNNEKGGLSIYGLGRFPVPLYYEQWIRLLGAAGDLRVFLEGNKTRLKLKDPS